MTRAASGPRFLSTHQYIRPDSYIPRYRHIALSHLPASFRHSHLWCEIPKTKLSHPLDLEIVWSSVAYSAVEYLHDGSF